MSRGKLLAALLLAGGCCAVMVTAAVATAPGASGKIAFRAYFDQQQSWGAVFTINPNGTAARQITRPPRGTVDDQPSWSPDGSLIAFTRCAGEGLCHIWVVAPTGTGLRPVGELCPAGAGPETCSDDANASFSPDSKQIAFTQATGKVRNDPRTEDWIQHSALTVMNRDGSGRHVIYQGPDYSGDLNSPVFSPDGKQLVFERHVSGFAKPAGKLAVYVVGIDGSGLRRLTPWSENGGDNPDWSPDGKWILYHSHVDESSPQSQYFLTHPDGTGSKQITHFPKGTHVASASFSPDGKSIVFSKGPEGGNVDVYTMRLDGGQVRRLTRSPLWQSAPAWGP
jgi:Tol biopolymer transport system component